MNSGTPPPSRCSILFESLPHLLPRQAFSFWPKKIPDRAEATNPPLPRQRLAVRLVPLPRSRPQVD
jgi:hypothetical protein